MPVTGVGAPGDGGGRRYRRPCGHSTSPPRCTAFPTPVPSSRHQALCLRRSGRTLRVPQRSWRWSTLGRCVSGTAHRIPAAATTPTAHLACLHRRSLWRSFSSIHFLAPCPTVTVGGSFCWRGHPSTRSPAYWSCSILGHASSCGSRSSSRCWSTRSRRPLHALFRCALRVGCYF
jgi:hypothetical protein